MNLRDYSKYLTDTSYEYNLDEEYKLIKEGVLMTLEEEIYNKMKNKTLNGEDLKKKLMEISKILKEKEETVILK